MSKDSATAKLLDKPESLRSIASPLAALIIGMFMVILDLFFSHRDPETIKGIGNVKFDI